jgi:lysophospholipase L1-like esterase
MHNRIAGACVAACVVACTVFGWADVAAAGDLTTARVVLVGDSTVAPLHGYGDALCQRFAPSVTCLNLARSGSSTLSYRQSGLWNAVLTLIEKPPYTRSYVLIQFGHNDQPGKPGRSTTLEEYVGNLKRYVREAREVGALPVLVTPLSRRQFEAGQLLRNLEPWAEAMRRAALESDAPLVDLNRDSAAALQEMGPTEANTLARGAPPPEAVAAALKGDTVALPPPAAPLRRAFDYTHLGPKGAEFFAAMVAQALREATPVLGRQISP